MTKLLFILLLLFGCSPTEPKNENVETFSGITETDTNGNLIGEVDSDDWCQFEFDMDATDTEFGLNPVYPNPVNAQEWGPSGNSCQVCYQYSSPFDETWTTFSQINIDIVSSENDTIYSFDDNHANGQIGICAYIPDSLIVDSVYRMYMASNNFSCYGDIQFE